MTTPKVSLWMFDNFCTGARSGRFVRRQVCVAEEDVAVLRPNHRQWQRVHDVKQNCTGVHSWNFHLNYQGWKVILEIRLRIRPRAASLKLGFVAEICHSMHNVSVAETQQLEGHAVSFLPTNWTYTLECPLTISFVKFLASFHKRRWKQFAKL